MADIELVIKIPEGLKKDFELEQWTALSCMEMKDALEKATPLPKGHGALKDADKIEDITWQEPYYHDALNILSEIRDKIRNQRTIIEADKEERK